MSHGVDLALEASVIEAAKQLARVDEGGVNGVVAVVGANSYVAGHVIRLFQRGGWTIRGAVMLTQSDRIAAASEDDRGRRYDDIAPNDAPPGTLERKWTHALKTAFPGVRFFNPIDTSQGDNFSEIFADCRYVVYADDALEDGFRRSPTRMLSTVLKGMTNALRAAIQARVNRFVLISSAVTIPRAALISVGGNPLDPSEWAHDPRSVPERQSWRLYTKHKPEKKTVASTTLLSVNAAFTVGPPISDRCARSVGCDFIRGCIDGSLMQRGIDVRANPGKLNDSVGVADVRDVAAAAFACITNPDACGRYLVSSRESYTRRELAGMLAECVDFEGFPVPVDGGDIAKAIAAASAIAAAGDRGAGRGATKKKNNRSTGGGGAGSLSSSSSALVVKAETTKVDDRPLYDCARTLELLGGAYTFRDPRKSMVDGANFLINKKLALKAREVVGPSGLRTITVLLPPLFEAPTHVHVESGWYVPAMRESPPHLCVNGRFAFIQDLVGRLPIASRTLIYGGIAAEATQAMRNLAVVVRAAGFPQRRWFIQELEVVIRTTRRVDHRHGPSHNDSFDPGGADDEKAVRAAIRAVCERIVAVPPGSEAVINPTPPMRFSRLGFLPYGVALSINAVVQRWTKARPKKDLEAGDIAALEAGAAGRGVGEKVDEEEGKEEDEEEELETGGDGPGDGAGAPLQLGDASSPVTEETRRKNGEGDDDAAAGGGGAGATKEGGGRAAAAAPAAKEGEGKEADVDDGRGTQAKEF